MTQTEMSEKRPLSEDESEEVAPAKMGRREAPTTNGVSGEEEPATPLPISNPFQERFRAPGLSAGEYHVLDEARSDDDGDDGADSDSDMDEDELMAMLDADLPAKFKGTRRLRVRGEESEETGEAEEAGYEERDKVVLIERGRNPVEPLPEGWVQVTHMSGLPVYLHRQSRVVTITRPYFLGPGSVRKHDVPLYSIPCLQYLRELQKEEAEKGTELDTPASCPVTSTQPGTPATRPTQPDAEDSCPAGGALPDTAASRLAAGPASAVGDQVCPSGGRVLNSEDSPLSPAADDAERSAGGSQMALAGAELAAPAADSRALTAVSDTGRGLSPSAAGGSGGASAPQSEAADDGTGAGPVPVEGTSMVVKDPSLTPTEVNEYCLKRFQFKTIRLMKFTTWRERRQYLRKKRMQRPQMSSKTKLLSFPVQPSRNSAAASAARPREWVLNPGGKSYVCILHEYLQHVLREQPVYSYSELENAATPYGATVSVQGVRYGSGYGPSKKQAKSEAAKATLQIFIPNLMDEIDADKTLKGSTKPADMDLSFFDSIRLVDPRVADLCSKAAEPSPYTILLICLQRNFGLTGNQVACKLHTNKHQHNEFEMTVGKHTARVPCKNKKDGKHLAAQSLLQQLHPHVTSWGSLLRMYGNHSSKSLKVKRQEEQQITLLQSKATVNSPNYAILDKLRAEMSKLQEVRKQIKPIGILQLAETPAGPSESGVTLDVVDL
ncbi:microprocessor complex subunit DGCR8-like [Pollicipes pollicipes]|uniref:microprocessor complex subunit DGCR8-like n=1 Tax=Pollicipes pollicipes TaxID=41117 RepID=UPI0018851363|nr:microprocessor complex subunit DGCR8-like [Pollicipes pollicipes]